jgi:hypothetical protein
VVVNSCLPDRWCGDAGALVDGSLAGAAVSADDGRALDEAAGFVGARRAIQNEQVARLQQRLPLPQIRLPYITDEIGPAAIGQLADALTAQIAGIPDR